MKNLFNKVKKSIKKSMMKDIKDDIKENIEDNKYAVKEGAKKVFSTSDTSIVETSIKIGCIVSFAVIIGEAPKKVAKAMGIGAVASLISSRFISGYVDAKYADSKVMNKK